MSHDISVSPSADRRTGVPETLDSSCENLGLVEWEPPAEFEEYKLIRPLGAGAMGSVYLAHDRLLDRPVAVKFINALADNTSARDRFFTEGRAIARLSHPNVVAVYRVGEVRRRPYLISEYVDGTSLASLAKPLPWQRVVKIGLGLARGLGAAHRRGVLHRDIKPANIMLGEDDEPKLLDFGLAKLLAPAAAPAPLVERPLARVTGSLAAQDLDATLSVQTTDPTSRPSPPITAAAISPLEDARHTRPGSLLGTPLYLAPEIWHGTPASQASDVYALGLVLYELLVGQVPYGGLKVAELALRIATEAVPSIRDAVADLPAPLVELIDACLRRDPARRPPSGDAVGDLLAGVSRERPEPPAGPPYRGLACFESAHRAGFFGRADETRTVVERLRHEPCVIIAGDSGTGKSSLCRAGVIPALTEQPLHGRPWTTSSILPGPGAAAALARALHQRGEHHQLLLFVDQLEELFTLGSPEELAAFTTALADALVDSSHLRILITVRSDFLGRLAALPELGALLNRALYFLGPPGEQGLRDAILEPLRAAGYRFADPATVEALATSGKRHLPLMQFALTELWELRDPARKEIPAGALARMGGVGGALTRHADRVLEGLAAAQRETARQLLLALVSAEGTRARRSHAELMGLPAPAAEPQQVLEALVHGRLLVVDEDESGEGSSYTLVHDALIEDWDTLRLWLGQTASNRALRARVELAARQWAQLGHTREALWPARLLGAASPAALGSLSPREAQFLRASRKEAARRRARRWTVALVAPVAVLALLLGGKVAARREQEAQLRKASAELSAARTARQALEHLQAQTFTAFDEHRDQEAEPLWQRSLESERQVLQAYASATHQLERLLQSGAVSGEARRLLAVALSDQADLAFRAGRVGEHDRLTDRLEIYDHEDPRHHLALLTLTTDRPELSCDFHRYQLVDGRWRAHHERTAPRLPTGGIQLEAGSWLLVLRSGKQELARVPVVLRGGESRHLELKIPGPDQVPPGYVFVAAGQFAFGSAEGETVRATFDSQPLHPVTTPSYFISASEVTFGEWLAFLRALPPEERARRTMNVRRQGFTVALTQLPSGRFQLTLGMDGAPNVVEEGQPLRYRGRRTAIEHSWDQLPVSGVSFEDAQAYAAWLSASGRVPGARLCTEHEWEKAARGADGRSYPHGERVSPADFNHDVTYGRINVAFGPDTVGTHPQSDSPYGVHDLSGNVWEWTMRNLASQDPIARGGSFFQAGAFARPENRAVDLRDRRDAFCGIRICAPAAN